MNIASNFLASIDQSTTSTKFSIFSQQGQLLEKEIIEHKQICPKEGYLEHDPIQIVSNVQKSISLVLKKMEKYPEFSLTKILGLGVCNQRETIVCWDKNGQPLYNAIVWCDARTKEICDKFKTKFGDFKQKTGLPISTYFSLFKIIWLLENVPLVQEKFKQDDIYFGTIDTWVIYKLTGKYVTDASNASRTYMANLNAEWDEQILKLYGIKKTSLPQIIDSFSIVGDIKQGQIKGVKVCCVLGDQQSSSYAHGLLKNQMKITYGTGCFLLSNIGTQPKIHESFITTILYKDKGKIIYGYEAAVECGGGTVNWAKKLGLLSSYEQLNKLQEHKSQVIFLPSFGSIFAPFWKDQVEGGFLGATFKTSRQDLLYSLLEAIAFRLFDNIKLKDFEETLKIVVDGGMTINPLFMQLNSTLFNKQIQVCQLDTCWGAAVGVLTALGIDHPKIEKINHIYFPLIQNRAELIHRYQSWDKSRKRVYGWQITSNL